MIRDAVSPGKGRAPGRVAAVLAAAAALAASAATPSAAPLSQRLPEAVTEAQKVVEKVRGVPFRGTVASALLPEKDLPKILGRKLVEDLPVPFPRYAASLAAVGFLDPESGLEEKLTQLYTRQVAGFYDPEVKKFFIVPERTTEAAANAPALGLTAGTLLEDTLLAHELTHALQDRRLDLVPRMKALKDSSDALLALEAFLEGEATVVMMDALLLKLPPETKDLFGPDTLSTMVSGLAAGTTNVEGSEGVPDFFVKEMLFPYVAGTAWIEAKRAGAGWAAIDASYDRPPSTTAEILHPGRAGTRAVLSPSDRPSAADVPPGMRVLYGDTFGEWMLSTLLERAGAADAKALAAEWRDDQILFFEPKVFEGTARPVGFIWRIRASSPDAARRIAAALAPLYEREDGRSVAAIAVADDRVEVVRGRPQPPKPVSPPAGTSAPPAGR
ncbi:MAG TPA: hypothetical protein VMV60_07100 [Thermoanaerobaculia bacterium]|nr:hypothetical protein [Thermoanaerobaculia bacterium]